MKQTLDNKALADDLRNLIEAEKRWTDEIVDAEITDLNNRQLQLQAEAKERENELLSQKLKLQESEQNRLKQQLALQEQQRQALLRDKEISELQNKQMLAEAELRQKEAEEKDRQNQLKLLESQRQQEQAKLEAEVEAQKAEKRMLYLYLLLGGALLVGFLVIFFIVRRKNRVLNEQKREIEEINADLSTKNEEITMQKESLMMANEEISHINEELTEQKQMVEQKNKSITDSIVYAQRIQQAVCPSPEFLRDLNFDYFMFFRPKEIVSGDFYWFYHEEDFIIAVAADCTGHGVPGAFMSMLGNSLLTKIVSERKMFEPSKILDILRDEVKKALHQEDLRSERKDGMDMSLVKINTKTLMLEFAAANNNAYIVRHYPKDQKALAEKDMDSKDMIKEVSDGYLRLRVLVADMMPIGVYIRDYIFFKAKQIQLQPGDAIYMTSDGYIDQFGGTSGTKFMSKNFKKLLLDIYPKPMPAQKKMVVETHEKWMGDELKQLDDIIVFGLKIL
jgi:serine phosphatase RsbU (regulator of sigma subunit)